MTDTATRPSADGGARLLAEAAPTAAAAARDTERALAQAARRAEEIRQAPELHVPKLVTSRHVRGESPLDKIADAVNRFCGSMWVFLGITTLIVVWLFAGNVVGFDKTPWPLLLTILNLPQLSIMISLQVSANRSQVASDKRAIADHETLISLHAMARQQIDILHGQARILDMLDNFARKDMPGTQHEIVEAVNKILQRVEQGPAASEPG